MPGKMIRAWALLSLLPVSAVAQPLSEDCEFVRDLEIPGESYLENFESAFLKLNPGFDVEETPGLEGHTYDLIAQCFWRGVAVDRNRDTAFAFMRLAVDKGSASARHVMASISVFQSEDPAMQVLGFGELEREFQAGSAYAAGKLGWAYQRGLGTERNLAKALELYEYAATQGMTYWQFLLSHAYEKGYLGLEKDDDKARFWLEYQPKQHIAVFECWVANYYRDGTFPPSEELAARYQALCDQEWESIGEDGDERP